MHILMKLCNLNLTHRIGKKMTPSAQIQTHASHKQGGGDLVLQDLESYHFVGKPPPVCKDEEDDDG